MTEARDKKINHSSKKLNIPKNPKPKKTLLAGPDLGADMVADHTYAQSLGQISPSIPRGDGYSLQYNFITGGYVLPPEDRSL